jgi:hypothetical protein
MNAATRMNYLALNQNILNKTMVFGSGPEEGKVLEPIPTFEGVQIYLNGYNVIPELGDLIEYHTVGHMTHPHAMDGMPGCSGELQYDFAISDNEYFILVRLKLDESVNGKSEQAVDVLAVIKRSEISEVLEDSFENYYVFCREMLLCHFERLFQFYESMDDLKEWTFNDDALHQMIIYHFDLNATVNSMKSELGE